MFIECHYNGKTYKYGQTFLAIDKCNKCSCMTKGSITCSQKKCISSATQETTTQKIDIFVVCRYNGQIFKFGQTFTAIDKCNKCICKRKGNIVCTKNTCLSTQTRASHSVTTAKPFKLHTNTVSCVYEGYVYTVHATFLARDGCNQCSCMYNGKVLCTKKPCSILPAMLGEDSSLSETNTKTTCIYHGNIYKITEIFVAIDQCNSCECIFPGRVICTHNICEGSKAVRQKETDRISTRLTKNKFWGRLARPKVMLQHGRSQMTETSKRLVKTRNTTTDRLPIQWEIYTQNPENRFYKPMTREEPFFKLKCRYVEARASQINKYPIINLEMKCFYHGKIYKITETFISVDECNSCECIYPGRVICGQSICEDTIGTRQGILESEALVDTIDTST
uniref:VWFC domain-containing protein n=1 Tax=Octopus bimaculoides TaxID=37653 RepID=A0A0L8G233_OCTBM